MHSSLPVALVKRASLLRSTIWSALANDVLRIRNAKMDLNFIANTPSELVIHTSEFGIGIEGSGV